MLSLVSWTQTLIYNDRWKTWKATLLGVGVGAVLGGLEVLLILTLRVVDPLLAGESGKLTL